MPDWKMPFPLRYYYQGEIPVEITVLYWGGFVSLEDWARAHSRLWVIYYGRPESQPMLSNLESFSVCERRDLPGLTVFICPGSEAVGAHRPGTTRDRQGAPLRHAIAMPDHL
jgi:hypothetical protein